MIYKSFYRKKTTKLYFIIFTLLFSLVTISILSKQFFLNYVNEKYSRSFIQVFTDEDINKINSINGIKSINNGIYLNDRYYVVPNEKINNNDEVIVHKVLATNSNDLSIIYNGNEQHYSIIDSHNNSYDEIEVSKDYYEILKKDNNPIIYRIFINNWLENETIQKEIKNTIEVKEINCYEYSDFNRDPTSIIIIFNIAIILVSILTIIVILISIQNVLIDEKKKDDLYRKLGFKIRTIKIYNYIKVISLLALSIILPIIIIIVSMFI